MWQNVISRAFRTMLDHGRLCLKTRIRTTRMSLRIKQASKGRIMGRGSDAGFGKVSTQIRRFLGEIIMLAQCGQCSDSLVQMLVSNPVLILSERWSARWDPVSHIMTHHRGPGAEKQWRVSGCNCWHQGSIVHRL